jgi:hypothetical protein
MEKTIIDTEKYEVSIGTTYHLDLWALLSINWRKYNKVDSIRLSADEVPEALNVPYNPRILGGVKHKLVGKCFTVNIDILCFRFWVETWKWFKPIKQSEGK